MLAFLRQSLRGLARWEHIILEGSSIPTQVPTKNPSNLEGDLVSSQTILSANNFEGRGPLDMKIALMLISFTKIPEVFPMRQKMSNVAEIYSNLASITQLIVLSTIFPCVVFPHFLDAYTSDNPFLISLNKQPSQCISHNDEEKGQ